MNPAAVAASYARALASRSGPGETMTLTRSGDAATYSVSGFPPPPLSPSALAGGVTEFRRTVIVLASEVVDAGFPLPFRANQDRVSWGSPSRTNVILDPRERRVQGTLIAYELEIEGG